jgi:hypothetical protein
VLQNTDIDSVLGQWVRVVEPGAADKSDSANSSQSCKHNRVV